MQESYIHAQIENHFNATLPVDQPIWFTNSQQILNCF